MCYNKMKCEKNQESETSLGDSSDESGDALEIEDLDSNSSDEKRSNEQRHKVEDYFHGDFNAMRDSYISIINRASSDGVFLVTNIPDEEYFVNPDEDPIHLLSQKRGFC